MKKVLLIILIVVALAGATGFIVVKTGATEKIAQLFVMPEGDRAVSEYLVQQPGPAVVRQDIVRTDVESQNPVQEPVSQQTSSPEPVQTAPVKEEPAQPQPPTVTAKDDLDFVTPYLILESTDAAELQTLVRTYSDHGYSVLGGVSVRSDRAGVNYYIQAVARGRNI